LIDQPLGRVHRIGGRRVRGNPSFASKAPIRHLDPTLVLTAFLLTTFGNVMVYSSSRARSQGQLLNRQLVFSVAGLVAMVVVSSFSYRRLKAWAPVLYGGGLLMLVFVLTPLGFSAKGAQRWINVGFFQLQPSEFMKIGALVALALFMSERKGEPGLVDALQATALLAPVALLIFLQPDLGTLLVLIALLITMLVAGGTRARVLLLMVVFGVVAIFGALHVGVLKDYQKARLIGFLDPSADTQRTNYNLNQARIGVGSGQVFGKGLFKGSQTNLSFVPEVHTDFIFVAVGEELGFFGAVILLALFAVFLWRGLRIAALSKDLFGTLLAAGVVAIVAFQMFVNIGMTIGVSPITGIPLPFVSYGGSSMLTTYVLTGILLNVHMRRV
jgi:rod shape determining protein RodA